MTTGITIAIVITLLFIAVGLYFLGPIFGELDFFLRFIGALLILVLGAGVYLSFTVPNIARAIPFTKKTETTPLQDAPIGISFEE